MVNTQPYKKQKTNKPKETSMDYAKAGVNIDAANSVVQHLKKNVGATHTAGVLTGIGSFGALFSLKEIMNEFNDPVLVQSVDGVGTKLKAVMAKKYRNIGHDIVNHCCNDILCQGAKPLSFLDYYGTSVLQTEVCKEVLDGIIEACSLSGTALTGGELAELPGIYEKDEFDVVGAITGVAEREKIVTGENIQEDDAIIALSSNGLHTNGYSLARKVLFDMCGYTVGTLLPGSDETVGDALLKPHLNYYPTVYPLLSRYNIKGMAHITGGGLVENVPRVLPNKLDAVFHCDTITPPPIFPLLAEKGKIERKEAYRTFNMGVGFILILPQGEVETILKDLQSPHFTAWKIGEIVAGSGSSVLS